MGLVPIFHAVVNATGDGLEFSTAEKRQRLAHLKSLGAGTAVEVIVRKFYKRRSNKQNRWERKALTLLGPCLGYRPDEYDQLHYALVARYRGTHVDERLGVTVSNEHSSQWSTKEYGEFMEWLVEFAMGEFNCYIPLPGEAELV